MVSEFGEIGRLVQYSEVHDMVILWAVYEVRENPTDNIYGKKGETIYRTSRGWIKGNSEEYFCSRPRERSLRPCILRAVDYAKEKYPGKRVETH